MKSVVKYKIKKNIPKKIWLFMAELNKKKQKEFYKEKKMSFGIKNPDIEVYIIRRRPPGGGLFSNVRHVLEGLITAENRNMVPVIDMQNYSTEYSKILPFNGTKNAWEYFFEPLPYISLSDAYKSKNIILSDGDRILKSHPMSGRNLSFVMDSKLLKYTHKVFTNNIQLNNYSKELIDEHIELLNMKSKSTLGVFYRGNDYLTHPATGHPIPPTIEEVINDIYKFIKLHSINKIFLSTDDISVRTILERNFGDIIYPNIRMDTQSELSNYFRNKFSIPNLKLAKTLSYLSEVYILSQLPFNISSLSNGSAMMYIINGGKYIDTKLYYLGIHLSK